MIFKAKRSASLFFAILLIFPKSADAFLSLFGGLIESILCLLTFSLLPFCNDEPTPSPTEIPTPSPTENPTPFPTENPTPFPTENPTPSPTEINTPSPTEIPTPSPTEIPTPPPTEYPTPSRTTSAPTLGPTPAPTPGPTLAPTPSDNSFDILLQIFASQEDEVVFSEAKTRWEGIITAGHEGEFPGATLSPIDVLVDAGCDYPDSIDDLYICASVQSIDGVGGVLGSAGPTWIFVNSGEPKDGLPFVGFMRFDEVDIGRLREAGTLSDVILHEMAHVLGIGTLWNLNGVAGTDAMDCPYTGTSANNEYEDITSCAVVPTETDFGPGTRCGHWDEDCLVNELMTGFVNVDATEVPLSRITIGSLEDLGYQVDYTQADAYGVDDIGNVEGCVCNRRELSIVDSPHGETRQLGLGSPNRKPRRLSEAARALAIEYGTAELKNRAEAFEGFSLTTDPNLEFVGDRVISVVVQDDDGSIYRVVVHAT